MNKKYQIFLSSTQEDLRAERDAVAKAILEIGDIPVGMEMFSAADEAQWKLIKRQIEQSDYYVVICAHRYGSMSGDLSYTEREYDFAEQIGVPVLGFIIEPTADWPVNRIDSDPVVKSKLDVFKAKIKTRMVSFWSNADNLNVKVLASLSKQKNLMPRPGWVRADSVPGTSALTEVAMLGQEVARLNNENKSLIEKASIDAQYELIDAMADDPEIQALILMYETGHDLLGGTQYFYAYQNGGAGSGSIGGFGRNRLMNAGLLREGGGHAIRPTNEGRRFAEWLLKKKRKCSFFWTEFGGWGELPEGSERAAWFNQMKTRGANFVDPNVLIDPEAQGN